MNVINFFKDLAQSWDEQSKCGSCWKFGAPLSESGLNKSISKPEEACCTHLFVTSYRIGSQYRYNGTTGLQNYEAADHSFVLYAVQQVTDIGQNVYNEIPDSLVDDGLWAKIQEPLLGCLGSGRELELCELGYDFDITSWIMETVMLKEDQNWTGWRITGTFRELIVPRKSDAGIF